MAHPSFRDLSFAQIARRAVMRSSYHEGGPWRSNAERQLVERAKRADARAVLGPHPETSRSMARLLQMYRVERNHTLENGADA